MNLHPDWHLILKRAWSIRLMALAAILSAVEAALPFFEHDIPSGWFALFSAVTVSGAFVARIVAQRNLNG